MIYRFLILALCFVLGTVSVAQTVVYINPANSADQAQDGTIGHPFDSWTDFAINSGTSYLQKAGTTAILTGSISFTGRTGVLLGAYDSGTKPEILSTGNAVHVIDIANSSNITIRNLDVGSSGQATSGILIDGISASGNLIENCTVHDCMWGIRIITASGGNRIMNTTIYNIGDDGIFGKDIPNIEIGYCNIYNVNQKWFTDRNDAVSSGDCIQLASLNSLSFYVHHCQLNHSSTGNKFCLIVAGETYSGIIENNLMTGNSMDVTSCLYLGNTSGTVTVRNNHFQNGNYGIYSYVRDLHVNYNVFSGNNFGIRVMADKNLTALNNSFASQSGYCISSLSGTSVTVQNTVFYLPTAQSRCWQSGGQWTSDYNSFNVEQAGFLNSSATLTAWRSATGNDQHSILGDPQFEDVLSGTLRLRSISPCIDKGFEVGLSSDFDGVSVPQGSHPDIGAFEYPSGTNEIITGIISGSPFCAGTELEVPFSLSGTVDPGNQFYAELSNPSGSFASAVVIGTISVNTVRMIPATIPINTPTGNGYRIRVRAGLPAITGARNAVNLTIFALPAAPVITLVRPYVMESGVQAGNQWYRRNSQVETRIAGATGYQYTATISGTYFSRVTAASGCESTSSNLLYVVGTAMENELIREVKVYPNPSSGIFIVESPAQGGLEAVIELTDLYGRKIESRRLMSPLESFSLQGFPAGVYLLRLKVPENMLILKILKSN